MQTPPCLLNFIRCFLEVEPTITIIITHQFSYYFVQERNRPVRCGRNRNVLIERVLIVFCVQERILPEDSDA